MSAETANMTNGLPNPTLNLCAVNACLQAVANADDVRDLVMRHQGEKKLSQLERTLQHMWGAPCPAKNDAVSLEVVRESNNKISYLGQKDAHEVLMAMIRMTEYTGLDKPIFRGFRGELSRQRSCLKCMEVNITCAKENFYCLPVSFMDSRSRKLSNAVKTSLVSTVGSVCNEDGCDGQEARHTATIVRHPRKLILLIKRFSNLLTKRIVRVEFNTSLLLGAEFYELTSVICHKGKDLAQGHYVCYILRDGSWYLYDDTRIQSVREEEVLSCEPYLMIFEKKQVNTTNIAAKSSSKEAEITGNATSDEAKATTKAATPKGTTAATKTNGIANPSKSTGKSGAPLASKAPKLSDIETMDTMEEPGKIVASTAIKIVKKKKTKRGKVSGAQKMRNRFANQYPNLLDDQESYLCFLKLYHANKAAANTVA